MHASKLAVGSVLMSLATGCGSDDGEPTTTANSTAATADTSTTSAASSDGGDGETTTGSADDTTESGGADTASGSADTAGSTGTMAMDTWENWALPSFFEVYCNHCHPGQSTRDFSVYDEVVANVVHIRCGVAPEALPDCDDHIDPGHLPIGDGPFPTDEERWRLVDWIDAGMPRD